MHAARADRRRSHSIQAGAPFRPQAGPVFTAWTPQPMTLPGCARRFSTWTGGCWTLPGNWTRQIGKGRRMAVMASPVEVLARVRTDVERQAVRARNGVKYFAGIGRPQVGQTPKDVVWKRDKVELWRYRSDRRRWRPPVFIVGAADGFAGSSHQLEHVLVLCHASRHCPVHLRDRGIRPAQAAKAAEERGFDARTARVTAQAPNSARGHSSVGGLAGTRLSSCQRASLRQVRHSRRADRTQAHSSHDLPIGTGSVNWP